MKKLRIFSWNFFERGFFAYPLDMNLDVRGHPQIESATGLEDGQTIHCKIDS
jgi:hypothetical protein